MPEPRIFHDNDDAKVAKGHPYPFCEIINDAFSIRQTLLFPAASPSVMLCDKINLFN